MARPRTISDEAILDAVLALAHRVGPARVTFAAAAAEAGLAAATLVQRFGSKRALLLAADKRGVDLWVGALDRSTAASPLAASRSRPYSPQTEPRASQPLGREVARCQDKTASGYHFVWRIKLGASRGNWESWYRTGNTGATTAFAAVAP